MEYSKADEQMMDLVARIAREHHKHLDGCGIAVVTKQKAGMSKGKRVMATARKFPDNVKPLFGREAYDFLIIVAMEEWDSETPEQREALIDHELCHCGVGENGAEIRHHDLEEFAAIIQRHGFWRGDIGEQLIQQSLTTRGIRVGTMELEKASGE